MISVLRGEVYSIAPGSLTLMAGGVGFLVSIPAGAEIAIKQGQEIVISTVMISREDSLELYGFPDPRQKEIFSLLIGVSGVGPKTAMNIVSGTEPNRFLDEVVSENINYLCSLPGIGRKSAQRIVLELKEKIMKHYPRQIRTGAGVPVEDAVQALIALGYSDNQARRAVSGIKADNVEDLIRQALKEMA
jgi:Holliday junction DNA helicase RuvA